MLLPLAGAALRFAHAACCHLIPHTPTAFTTCCCLPVSPRRALHCCGFRSTRLYLPLCCRRAAPALSSSPPYALHRPHFTTRWMLLVRATRALRTAVVLAAYRTPPHQWTWRDCLNGRTRHLHIPQHLPACLPLRILTGYLLQTATHHYLPPAEPLPHDTYSAPPPASTTPPWTHGP